MTAMTMLLVGTLLVPAFLGTGLAMAAFGDEKQRNPF